MASTKSKLSAAMLGLLAAGASAPVLMSQFQEEKEGTSLIAYPDAGGVWTICGGVTRVDGKPVVKGMQLTREQCDKIDKAEQAKALAWVKKKRSSSADRATKSRYSVFLPVEHRSRKMSAVNVLEKTQYW